MCRATSMATNLAVAVAATAVGCTLVISLTPSLPDAAGKRPSGGATRAAASGHAGSAARAATSALHPAAAGADPGKAGDSGEFDAAPTGRIEVTEPEPGVDYKANGSFTVAWRNSTGEPVDVWLRAATGQDRSQRVALVVPRSGAGPAGEAIVTLPKVPPGPHYFLEVSTAGDAAVGGLSRTFAITE
ncbi:hypothetical protein ACFW81_27680 [Streptomyces angustmyceticus]|uniref:hypothetical protein n=1 Tax=Streptomyces angustmyceticus TaxID=285578 RepID=UPI0036C477D6